MVWRPAAAVIPAPIAYIKVVAVKKLVVGFLGDLSSPVCREVVCSWLSMILPSGIPLSASSLGVVRSVVWIVYFEEIRVFKAGVTCL